MENEIDISGGSAQGFVQSNYGNVTIHIHNLPDESNYKSPGASSDESSITECPYRSLFAFRPEDSSFYFGREDTIQRLTQLAEKHNLISIVGASGSGKSSLVFAGLVPALSQTGKWEFTTFRPGKDPFLGLARSLVSLYEDVQTETDKLIAARKLSNELQEKTLPISDVIQIVLQKGYFNRQILIIVDQFEQLYTLCTDSTVRKHFTDTFLNLVELAKTSSLCIVLTLRADFVSQASLHPYLAEALQNSFELLRPMTPDKLRSVIEQPAKLMGVSFEEELIDRIVNDLKDEPGSLPLLEFALTELWIKQSKGVLTHVSYTNIGEVKGALSRYADRVYKNLSAEEKKQAERIFLQLVKPGEGTEDTRRIATRRELEKDWPLVVKLATKRLVVTNRDENEQEVVEVVHEALIRNWPMLKEWLVFSRDFRNWQERFRDDFEKWREAGKEDSDLLRGIALVEAEKWLIRRHSEIPDADQGFIQTSLHKKKEEEQQRLLAFVGANIAAIVMTVLAIFSLTRSQQCKTNNQFSHDSVSVYFASRRI